MPKPLNRQVNTDDHLHMLSQELDLTKAQQAKIKPILEHYLQQRQQIEMNNKLSVDEKSARLQSSERSSHSKMRALLTTAQKKTFDDMMGADDDTAQAPSKAQKKK
jgi:Spy/CpxP family protein refolding chaperone